MGRPVVNGREIIYRNCNVVGICLGHGGFSEHHIDDNAQYIQRFNVCFDMLGLSFMLSQAYQDPKIIKSMIKNHKDDEKLLGKLIKQNKNTIYEEYKDYILRPHINIFDKEILINNTTFEGNPGLVSGAYYYVALEGISSWGVSEDLFKKRLAMDEPYKESDIFYSSDYANSLFHKPDLFMSSWSCGSDNLTLAINKSIGHDIVTTLKNSLQNGYLALVYGVFDREALSLVFVDKLMETFGQTPTYLVDKLEKKLSSEKMNLF